MAQARRIKAEAKAAQEVEATMDTAVQETKQRRKRAPLTITAEEIRRERDARGLSWAQVAKNLNLPSPRAAHMAYVRLTGEDSKGQGKRTMTGFGVRSTKTFAVQWDDDSDQDEIEERLNGAWVEEAGSGKDYRPGHWSGSLIIVQRKYGVEEVKVGHCKAFTFGPNDDKPLTVEVKSDQGAYRAFYVKDILEVRS